MSQSNIKCTSSSVGGISAAVCRSSEGTYVGISCEHDTCTLEGGGHSNVRVPSLDGVKLETGDCDQACKDRLARREQIAIKKAVINRELAVRYCDSHPEEFAFYCSNGYYTEVYNSLSDCEAHRLSREDEMKGSPARAKFCATPCGDSSIKPRNSHEHIASNREVLFISRDRVNYERGIKLFGGGWFVCYSVEGPGYRGTVAVLDFATMASL
jgi:hypothetical protein